MKVGTNNMVIQTGFYISFGDYLYDRVTKIDETISIYSSTEIITTFAKDIESGGYYYLSDDVAGLTTPLYNFQLCIIASCMVRFQLFQPKIIGFM